MKYFLLASLVAGCGAVSGARDAGDSGFDAGVDAGQPFVWPSLDGGAPCVPESPPSVLSKACLYSDIATRTVRADLVEYEPSFALWADHSGKRRWLFLPEGKQIDTASMDYWQFPVGASAFKEFELDGGVLETRMIRRTGPSEYQMVSFLWRADGGAEADAVPTGRDNVLGTAHDVPEERLCHACHDGEPGRIIGFSAVLLSKPGPGLNLKSLAQSGKLSAPPPLGVDYPVPGSPVQKAALGYLHANCGSCHNPNGEAYLFVNQVLRLGIVDTVAEKAPAQVTSSGRRTTALYGRQADNRVLKGSPEDSDLWLRMGLPAGGFIPKKMPPYGTEVVDEAGRAAIAAWIMQL